MTQCKNPRCDQDVAFPAQEYCSPPCDVQGRMVNYAEPGLPLCDIHGPIRAKQDCPFCVESPDEGTKKAQNIEVMNVVYRLRRPRDEIETQASQGLTAMHVGRLQLEVLLDIRDLLQEDQNRISAITWPLIPGASA